MLWLLTEVCVFLQELVSVLYDRASHFISGLWYSRVPRRLLPPVESPLLMQSATSLADKIRTGKVKSVDVVEAYIERIKQVEPVLNALVDERFEAAIAEAAEVDEAVLSGSGYSHRGIKPLLGVPVTTKNYVGVRGCLQDTGSWYLKGHKAEEDATVIRLLREAGAIPLAISNVPELCFSYDCGNTLYGRTSNPYDTNRIPGGSSGGEGAWLASAASIIGVGTDLGGSVRIPAACCGIFSHKPTAGIVSQHGLYPDMGEGPSKFNTVGPMVRYAEDLLPVFKAMVGTHGATLLHLDSPVNMRTVKLYHMSDDGAKYFTRVTGEMSTAVCKAVSHLESVSGSTSQALSLPELLTPAWSNTFTAAFNRPLSVLMKNGQDRANPLWELLLTIVGRSYHTLQIITAALVERFETVTAERLQKYAAEVEASGKKLQGILADDGVLIFPANFAPAPYHYEGLRNVTSYASFTLPFNIIGVPVSLVPVMMSEKEGVPIGVQVVGGRGSDRLCLAVVKELGKAFGGWKIPPVSRCTK